MGKIYMGATGTGKNLIDKTQFSANTKCTITDNVITTSPMNTGDRNITFYFTNRLINPFKWKSGKTYYISADVRLISGTTNGGLIRMSPDVAGTYTAISNPVITNTFQRYQYSYTTPIDVQSTASSRFLFQFSTNDLSDGVFEVKNVMLSYSSDITYKDYINLPNTARNVVKAYVGVSDVAKEVTKVYVGVNDKARLVYPDLYEIVNNLESTGTQYINTGVKVAKDIKMELDLKFNTLSADTQANGGYFQESGTSYKNYILLLTSDNINWDFTLGVWNKQKTIANADTNRHTFSIDCVNGECSLDQDVYTLSNISGDYTATNDILLFARSMSNGSVIAHASQTLYGAKIWKNNVLVRNFVPAKRKTDNVLGLLDTITNTFYENQGTGTFSIEQ